VAWPVHGADRADPSGRPPMALAVLLALRTPAIAPCGLRTRGDHKQRSRVLDFTSTFLLKAG
jgi:hypothetical protein